MNKYELFIKYAESHYDEVVSQIEDFLKSTYADTFQKDLYCYVADDGESAEFDTFVNVGGNSWLNDDHITVCRHTENYSLTEELAELVESPKAFRENYPDKPFETADEDGEELEDSDIVRGIVKQYEDFLTDELIECIKTNGLFVEQAQSIADAAIEEAKLELERY